MPPPLQPRPNRPQPPPTDRLSAAPQLYRTALHEAASTAHVECVQLLLAAGADVNSRAEFSATPLHGVVFFPHGVFYPRGVGGRDARRVLELLIAAGAEVNARMTGRRHGRTALTDAVHAGHGWAVRLLLRHGADTSARDVRPGPPLQTLAISPSRSFVPLETRRMRRSPHLVGLSASREATPRCITPPREDPSNASMPCWKPERPATHSTTCARLP